MIIRAKDFKGYVSKPDALIDHPEIGQDCLNVIVNKGDLCNIPYPIRQIEWLDKLHFCTFHNDNDTWYLVSLDNNSNLYVIKKANEQQATGSLTREQLNELAPEIFSLPASQFFHNFLSFGDWLYLFEQLPTTPNVPYHYRRMLRFKFSIFESIVNIKPSLVGIQGPIAAEFLSWTSGYFGDTYDFAFTFITDFPYGTISDRLTLKDYRETIGLYNIESNAIILNDEKAYTLKQPTFKLYFPYGFTEVDPLELPGTELSYIRVGAYVKKSTETLYSFIGYYALNEVLYQETTGDYAGYYYKTVEIDVPSGWDRNTDRIANEIGHSVPKCARHYCYFKNRLYSLPVSEKLYIRVNIEGSTTTRAITTKGNKLQVSPLLDEIINDTGLSINYPDLARISAFNQLPNYINELLEQPIGDDNIDCTGLIEYMGQLIIFKKDSTYVLTDDITRGELRLLFPTIGCIGGRKAYIIIDNILYFVSREGLYAYNGENPTKISDPIEEDFRDSKFGICLSTDPRYRLLFITFPNAENTLIYHCNLGIWTKMDGNLKEVLQNIYGTIYFNRNEAFEEIGTIDSTAIIGFHRTAFWKSGLLTGGDDVRRKHWKEFTLESQIPDVGPALDISIHDEQDRLISKIYDIHRTVHLGMHTKAVSVKVHNAFSYNHNPFRVNGFSLTGVFKGRR